MHLTTDPRRAFFALGALLASFAAFEHAAAQTTRGTISGRVLDTAGTPVSNAVVVARDTRAVATTSGAGVYHLNGLTSGRFTIVVRRLGLAADSVQVALNGESADAPDIRLIPIASVLSGVAVQASARLNETREAALARRDEAENFVVVQSGDEIRSLPNANAAEALARMPGVSTERDEGEGKFVQIRGTEPRLSNVTINGAHVPGTESSDRIPKLDDVPSDVLGAVEVSETLRADMDADAIGGSVNLVTKTPEGAPRGYLALQGGQQDQLNSRQGSWSAMYGGHFGDSQKLGALFGLTFDRNNRSIEDVEPAWGQAGSRNVPVEWDQRDYVYGRMRTGGVADIDYKFDNGSTLAFKGLFSDFKNYGTRYRFDAATGGDSASMANGASGIGTGATFVREVQQRRPDERMYGFTLGGQTPSQPIALSYGVDLAGTSQHSSDYRTNDFEWDGPGGNGVPLRYDGGNLNLPRYSFASASDSAQAMSAGNYTLTKYSLGDGLATGRDIGGRLDATYNYLVGTMPSVLSFGAKVRNESKSYQSRAQTYKATQSVTLDQVLSSFADPSFYSNLSSGFVMGPEPSESAIESWENANPGAFKNATNVARDSLGSYTGGETIGSLYMMHTSTAGAWHVNLGLRSELTNSSYTGHVSAVNNGVTTITTTPGSQNYVDLFPSVTVRYDLTDRADLRAAVTKGIARPNYIDLAPHLSGDVCTGCANSIGNVSAGNPNLKPQHAWNFDLLGEQYFTRAGLLSAGVFYKRITGFIYDKNFIYNGPVTEFDGYLGTEPENGGDATLEGFEMSYTQRLYMLPGLLSGLGWDVNWTHTDSRAALLSDTSSVAGSNAPLVTRSAPLLRQAPNVGNVAGTYELGRVSARLAWQYQGASIYSYGDGSASPSGDTYLYAHKQLDASMLINVTRDAQIQIQGLDLNNAVFGFYNGDPGATYDIQREVYGRSFIVGVRYGF